MASRSNSRSPSSRWRTRRAHHPDARCPGGSSEGHASQPQSPGDGTAVGLRRARTKNAFPSSIVPVAPARAAPRARLPHLCQANSIRLRPGSPQTGQGGVPQRGWRVARHLARCSNVEGERPQRGHPRSVTPVKGSTCRPEATKYSCIERVPGCGSMSTRVMPC